MRKICVMATVIATMVFMTACGGNKEEATTAVTTTQETTTVAPTTTAAKAEKQTTKKVAKKKKVVKKKTTTKTTKKAKNEGSSNKSIAKKYVGKSLNSLTAKVGSYKKMEKYKSCLDEGEYDGLFYFDGFIVSASTKNGKWIISGVE